MGRRPGSKNKPKIDKIKPVEDNTLFHWNETIQKLNDIKELMKEIKTMYKTNDIKPSNYNNLYSNGLINTYDLNRIQNMGNNYNNDSHNQTIVNMTNNITNNNLTKQAHQDQ